MAETNRLKEAALKEALASAERKLAEWPKLADAAVAAYKTRVVELTEALAAAEQRIASQRDQIHQSCIATTELSARAKAAESECSALRAENQHLRAIEDGQRTRAEAAEARVAAANALLARLGVWADTYGAALVPSGGATDSFGDGVRACKAQVKALLANQPTEPTVAETDAPRCRDCGWLLSVIPDGFGEAYTCARCDTHGKPAAATYQQQRAEEAACAASDALLARPTFEHPGAEQMFNQLRAARSRAEGTAPRADLDGSTPRERRVSPARTRRVSTPAEAAQAVLEAMGAVTDGELGLWITYGSRAQIQVAKAELARRKEMGDSK